MSTKHTPTPWTVSYMVRERKGDYLAAVEQLEASHEALVEALKMLVDDVLAYFDPNAPTDVIADDLAQAKAALKMAREDTKPEAERIAQVIAAWNMRQDETRLCREDTFGGLSDHFQGHLCIHQIRELAELMQAELARKEAPHA